MTNNSYEQGQAQILQSRRNDEAKVATLQALHPRMQVVGIGLQNISSHRYVDLKQLLSGEDDEEPGIHAAMSSANRRARTPGILLIYKNSDEQKRLASLVRNSIIGASPTPVNRAYTVE